MVNSNLWRAIIALVRVLAELVHEFGEPENPLLAIAEDLLSPFLATFGISEQLIYEVVCLLQDCLERMRLAERREFRPTFCRPDLLWPGEAAARYVLNQRNDAGFMQFFRVDVSAMDWIYNAVSRVSPVWVANRNDPTRGFNLDARHCIAAALSWMGSTCNQSWLQQAFGNTRSPMSRDLCEGLRNLLDTLRAVPEASIRWPNPEDMEWYFDLMCQARDSLPPIPNCKVFGWIDGFRSVMFARTPHTHRQVTVGKHRNSLLRKKGVFCLACALTKRPPRVLVVSKDDRDLVIGGRLEKRLERSLDGPRLAHHALAVPITVGNTRDENSHKVPLRIILRDLRAWLLKCFYNGLVLHP